MKKGIVLFIPLLVLASGCIPTIIGAAVYKSSKTRQAKESFIEQFNATNLEREKAGLPPLDLCTEKYNFDKKWADDDVNHRTTILRKLAEIPYKQHGLAWPQEIVFNLPKNRRM